MLKDSIILTAEVDKTAVLEYIYMGKYFPKSIIFIDDQLKNLESLNRFCDKLEIKFHRVHYIAVSLLPLPVIYESLELARFKILEE